MVKAGRTKKRFENLGGLDTVSNATGAVCVRSLLMISGSNADLQLWDLLDDLGKLISCFTSIFFLCICLQTLFIPNSGWASWLDPYDSPREMLGASFSMVLLEQTPYHGWLTLLHLGIQFRQRRSS